jgi:predicted dinucleotide-binding enzyme
MSDITIIGTGSMARGLASRALAAGKSVQLLAHEDRAKAESLAGELGDGVTPGVLGDSVEGEIVIPAVYFDASKAIASQYGDALAGKVYVDITNPVDFSTFDSLAVAAGSSAAEELQKLTPATVVKAFNTTFAGTLVAGTVSGQQLDVLIAGDDDSAVTAVSDFAAAAGLKPITVGPLRRAQQLEQTGFLNILLSANDSLPEYQWDSALKFLPAV